jgi:hypothetical protein
MKTLSSPTWSYRALTLWRLPASPHEAKCGRLLAVLAVGLLLTCLGDSCFAQGKASFEWAAFRIEPPADFVPYGVGRHPFWRSNMTLEDTFQAAALGRVNRVADKKITDHWDKPPGGVFKKDFNALIPPDTASIRSHWLDSHWNLNTGDPTTFVHMNDYLAESDTGNPIQGYGTVRMIFQRNAGAPKLDPLAIRVEIKNPQWKGTAGVDFEIRVTHVIPGVLRGVTDLTVRGNGANKVNPVIDVTASVKSGNLFQDMFTSDVSAVKAAEWVMVRVTPRVWASKPMGKPAFPNTAPVPEPASWALGLTGLAAVIGTQAWKKRYPKSAV